MNWIRNFDSSLSSRRWFANIQNWESWRQTHPKALNTHLTLFSFFPHVNDYYAMRNWCFVKKKGAEKSLRNWENFIEKKDIEIESATIQCKSLRYYLNWMSLFVDCVHRCVQGKHWNHKWNTFFPNWSFFFCVFYLQKKNQSIYALNWTKITIKIWLCSLIWMLMLDSEAAARFVATFDDFFNLCEEAEMKVWYPEWYWLQTTRIRFFLARALLSICFHWKLNRFWTLRM